MDLTINGLDQFVSDMYDAESEVHTVLSDAMVQSINQIKNDAQNLAPFVTGTLRRSIYTVEEDNGMTGIIGQDAGIAPYGSYVEYGTLAHDIYPTEKKALAWPNAAHPFKHVRHPGTQPQPFMEAAFDSNIEQVVLFFELAILKMLNTMAGK